MIMKNFKMARNQTVIMGFNDNNSLRKSKRLRRKPNYLNDYVAYEDNEHMALNATSFVDEVPRSYSEIEERSDRVFWLKAIEEEIESLNRNKTWKVIKLHHIRI